jgi:Flp pilus assembly protein TadB
VQSGVGANSDLIWEVKTMYTILALARVAVFIVMIALLVLLWLAMAIPVAVAALWPSLRPARRSNAIWSFR